VETFDSRVPAGTLRQAEDESRRQREAAEALAVPATPAASGAGIGADGDTGAASTSVSAADAEAAQAASQAALARSLPAYPGPYPVPRDAELARMSDESIELMLRLAVEEDGAPGGLWSDNGSADGVKLSASSDAVPGARGTGEVAYPQDAIV